MGENQDGDKVDYSFREGGCNVARLPHVFRVKYLKSQPVLSILNIND
jgi:hypothetical protein